MTTQTLTLTEFLLARIAEDERLATLATTRDEWAYEGFGDFGPFVSGASIETEDSVQGQDIARYIEHLNPWRVLAECEAKRQIVEWAQADLGSGHATQIYRLFALPYADHPDFREEWRP